MRRRHRQRSDRELLELSGRAPEAFGEFYARHEDAVLVYMLRRTRNVEAAADLTAEVFAAALVGAAVFTSTSSPG